MPLKVILLTAMSAVEGEPAANQLGVPYYITKPFDPRMVEAAVKVALSESGASIDAMDEGPSTPVWAAGTPGKGAYEPGRPGFIRPGQKLMSLEKQLGGGIPLGSLTLVEGSSSSGKSVLCQHLAYGALLDGHAVAYFTSEKSPKALTGQMGSIGLGVSNYVRGDKLRMYPIKEPNEAGTTNDGEDPGSLMASLSADVENLTDKHRVIIIDSISNLATFTPDLAVLSFFSFCKRLCNEGRTIIVVGHSAAFEETLLRRIRFLCDGNIILRHLNLGRILGKTLAVNKIQGAELGTDNPSAFEVELGDGIRILPMARVKA